MVSKIWRMGFAGMFVLTCQFALAQENGNGGDEGRSDSGSAQMMDFRWGKTQIELPVLETYQRDVVMEGYRGVDDIFLIREANPNVSQGQWQFELAVGWDIWKSGDGNDDNITLTPSIKYGITDDFNIELEVLPINFGDGSRIEGVEDFNNNTGLFEDDDDAKDGLGELNFKMFWRLWEEQGLAPAFAMWSEIRIPSGENSEKFDGTLHFNFTKTMWDGVRGHLAGFIKTANGSKGDYNQNNIGDRRDFQWGVGTGMDFALDDQNLLVVNYLNHSSQYDGNSTTNSVELGWVHHLSDTQQLQIATRYNDTNGGFEEGPRWSTNIQWSVAW